jgi:hypothetical protein
MYYSVSREEWEKGRRGDLETEGIRDSEKDKHCNSVKTQCNSVVN